MNVLPSHVYKVIHQYAPVTLEHIKIPERFAPSWPEVNLMDFPLSRLPRCVVVDYHADTDEFIYRFWGTKVTELHDQDLTGKSIRQLDPPEMAELIFNQYKDTVEAKTPILFTNMVTQSNGIMTEESVLRLPLSHDGESVSHLVCAFDFGSNIKAFRKYLDDGRSSNIT